MLATPWTGQDPSGWLMSEKLYGFRAVWNGYALLSRTGKPFNSPDWFTKQLPLGVPRDGELWAGYGVSLAELQSRVRGSNENDWRGIKFHVFDIPDATKTAAERIAALSQFSDSDNVVFCKHLECFNREHLMSELWKVFQRGGEGLIIRKPDAGYVHSKHDRDYTKVSLKVYVADNLRYLPES